MISCVKTTESRRKHLGSLELGGRRKVSLSPGVIHLTPGYFRYSCGLQQVLTLLRGTSTINPETRACFTHHLS